MRNSFDVGFLEHIKNPKVICDGFLDTCELLIEKFKTNAYGEHLLYPFLFCLRHSVEMILKSVLDMQNYSFKLQLMEEKPIINTHNLSSLYESIKNNLDKDDKEYEEFLEILQSSEEIIKQIDALDKNNETFRYSYSRNKEKIRPNYNSVKDFKNILSDEQMLIYTEELEKLFKKVCDLQYIYYYYSEVKIPYLVELKNNYNI